MLSNEELKGLEEQFQQLRKKAEHDGTRKKSETAIAQALASPFFNADAALAVALELDSVVAIGSRLSRCRCDDPIPDSSKDRAGRGMAAE